jgi:Zn-dependent membrane protease YugP
MKTEKETNYLLIEQKKVGELARHIMRSEGLEIVPVKFGRVGRGGANIVSRAGKILCINIDLLNTCIGSVYVIAHEVAHYIQITQNANYKHDRTFKKTYNGLVKKYFYCEQAQVLLF